MKTKHIISFILALVITTAIWGGYKYPKTILGVVSTPATSTFTSAKVAEVGFSPTTATATSTSILNSDSTDRVVTDSFYYCNGMGTSLTAYSGVGLANLIFTAATTSAASPIGLGNNNLVLSSNVATSSAGASVYTASTTIPFPNDSSRLWASGSYMTFYSNATNTAACVIGVHYLAS